MKTVSHRPSPWLAALLLSSPWASQAAELAVDNQLLRDAKPWPIEHARIRLGHGRWQFLSLSPGVQRIDVPGEASASTAVLELQLPGRQWAVSSIGVGPEHNVRIAGEVGEFSRHALLASGTPLPGSAQQPLRMHNATGEGGFTAIEPDQVDQAWSAQCGHFQPEIPLAMFVCKIDVEPQPLSLLLGGLSMPGSSAGYFWGTLTTARSAADWLADSAGCKDPLNHPCPKFGGWAWLAWLGFDIEDLGGHDAARLSVYGASTAFLHYSGYASFGVW